MTLNDLQKDAVFIKLYYNANLLINISNATSNRVLLQKYKGKITDLVEDSSELVYKGIIFF